MSSDICKINPGYDETMFWVDEWAPQIEILANPATKVGITHCGMSSILEFIHAGVVPLCFPHFGEQGSNTDNILERGAGLSLVPTSCANTKPAADDDSMLYYEKPSFDGADVAAKIGALLSKPEFAENLMTLKMCAAAAGGGEKAVSTIEEYYVESALMAPGQTYLEHKSDDDYIEKMGKTSKIACCFWGSFVTGSILFLLLWGFPGLLNMDDFKTHYA